MTLIRQIYTDFFKCDFAEGKICLHFAQHTCENLLHQCYLLALCAAHVCAKKIFMNNTG